MIATKDKVVAVSYTLTVDDGETGMRWYETVTEQDPFYFLFGHHNLLRQVLLYLARIDVRILVVLEDPESRVDPKVDAGGLDE